MRHSNRHLTVLILGLAVLGLSIFFYRYLYLGVPLTPGATLNSWTVEAHLKFKADRDTPVKASFFIPNNPLHYATLDEYFVSRNYGVTTNMNDQNRETVWSIRRAHGLQSLYYRVVYRRMRHAVAELPPPDAVPPKPTFTEGQQAVVTSLIERVRSTSADVQTFAQETVKWLAHPDHDDAKILMGDEPNTRKIVRTAVLILNQANISALLVDVLPLDTHGKAAMKAFLAVYTGKNWVFIDPTNGTLGLPLNNLVWKYGDAPLFNVTGGHDAQFTLAVSSAPISALHAAKIRGKQSDSILLQFSLLQLPVDVQKTYKILLTVPIGAFIILLLRNFVGLVTFGTFMPILIALAFRETHMVWGIILFSTIVAIGLLVRFYLDQLRLLLVPRLATILTVVILLMAAISVVSEKLGLETGLSVALFPMVILTMTIERMCITWDERGPADAFKYGLGSLVAAAIAYAAMHNEALEYLVFAFPELLLVLMAIILWFGQYRGYRLMELIRFKALSKP